jgi:hypothetical protein
MQAVGAWPLRGDVASPLGFDLAGSMSQDNRPAASPLDVGDVAHDPAGDGPRIATPRHVPAPRRGHGAMVDAIATLVPSRLAAIRQVLADDATTGL